MHQYKKSRYLCRSFLMHRLFVKKRLSTFAHILLLQSIKTYAIQSKISFTFTPAAEPFLQHCDNLPNLHIPNADAGAAVRRAASKETADNKLV